VIALGCICFPLCSLFGFQKTLVKSSSWLYSPGQSGIVCHAAISHLMGNYAKLFTILGNGIDDSQSFKSIN